MIGKDFILAGWAIFTIEIPEKFTEKNPECKRYYTFRVDYREANEQYPEAWFVNLKTGPDSYAYLGILNAATGKVRLTGKSKETEDSWPFKILNRVLGRIWANEGDLIEAQGWQVHHEGFCCVCGSPLNNPDSIRTGIGPVCAKRLRGQKDE